MVQPFSSANPLVVQFFDEVTNFLDQPRTAYFEGTQILRPVVQIDHLGREDGFDYFSAALKIRVLGNGSYAKGLSIEGDSTGGNLIEAYNRPFADPDPYIFESIRTTFLVRADNRVGINTLQGGVVSAALDVRQTDLFVKGVQIVAVSDLAADLLSILDEDALETVVVSAVGEFFSSRNAFFFGTGVTIGDNEADFGGGNFVLQMEDSDPPPTTGPSSGVILQSSNSKMRYWDRDSNIWRWPDGNAIPEVHNLLAWNYDPAMALGSAQFSEGTVYLMKLLFHRSTQPTTIRFYVTNSAPGPTNSFFGIYDTSGTLLATTADESAQLTSVGTKSVTLLTPPVFEPGYHYIAVLCGAGPGLGPNLAITGAPAGVANVNLAGADLRFAEGPTGQTSLPASITMSSLVSTANQAWVGIA